MSGFLRLRGAPAPSAPTYTFCLRVPTRSFCLRVPTPLRGAGGTRAGHAAPPVCRSALSPLAKPDATAAKMSGFLRLRFAPAPSAPTYVFCLRVPTPVPGAGGTRASDAARPVCRSALSPLAKPDATAAKMSGFLRPRFAPAPSAPTYTLCWRVPTRSFCLRVPTPLRGAGGTRAGHAAPPVCRSALSPLAKPDATAAKMSGFLRLRFAPAPSAPTYVFCLRVPTPVPGAGGTRAGDAAPPVCRSALSPLAKPDTTAAKMSGFLRLRGAPAPSAPTYTFRWRVPTRSFCLRVPTPLRGAGGTRAGDAAPPVCRSALSPLAKPDATAAKMSGFLRLRYDPAPSAPTYVFCWRVPTPVPGAGGTRATANANGGRLRGAESPCAIKEGAGRRGLVSLSIVFRDAARAAPRTCLSSLHTSSGFFTERPRGALRTYALEPEPVSRHGASNTAILPCIPAFRAEVEPRLPHFEVREAGRQSQGSLDPGARQAPIR